MINTSNKSPATKRKRKPIASKAKRVLFDGSPSGPENRDAWTARELKALVQYIALYYEPHIQSNEKPWPFIKDNAFWEKCAVSIAELTNLSKRSGNACRTKVIKTLSKQYRTVDHAEDDMSITYISDTLTGVTTSNAENQDGAMASTPSCTFPSVLDNILCQFEKLSDSQRLHIITQMFAKVLSQINEELKHFVSPDFIRLSANAMNNLYQSGNVNTMYHLAKCLGEMRPDGSGTRMPIGQMPFGLISYNCQFFACDDTTKIKVPNDYMSWVETMYSHFGNKWSCLFNGPMWSYEEDKSCETRMKDIQDEAHLKKEPRYKTDIVSEASLSVFGAKCLPNASQDCNSTSQLTNISTNWSGLSTKEVSEIQDSDISPLDIAKRYNIYPVAPKKTSKKKDPLTAMINVAAPSARTIRRHVENSGIPKGTEIQVQALSTAHKSNEKGRWWIKADGTDMKSGLRESMRHEWSGDSDLGNGVLQKKEDEYRKRLQAIVEIQGKKKKEYCKIQGTLAKELSLIKNENAFIQEGLEKAKLFYKTKKKDKTLAEDSLFALAWEVEEYEELRKKNGNLINVLTSLTKTSESLNHDVIGDVQKSLEEYVKSITTKKRKAASHLLIFMIADEQRDMKPYAIPVRILPYHSITDSTLRKLRDEIRTTMQSIGMTVVGFATDGEFNSLRTMGSERPVSVIQLIMDAKKEARSMSVKEIERYLHPYLLGLNHDVVDTFMHHDAIPREDVIWLYSFMHEENTSFETAIHVLRRKHFPFHYDPHPWIPGKAGESKSECLKSLMATYLYRHKILNYESTEQVNFREHLYVPEANSEGVDFHEREDHNHILKRIATCLRNGDVPGIDLHHFVEALHDPSTGLTYTALTGQHKQSVPDSERLFSPAMARYMERNGHMEEAKFISIVSNWHKATDGRGLTELQRHNYNMSMLNYILEDWMPWYWYQCDYSTIDVNRPLKGIKGFTREIIVAITANVESQEKRRRDCTTKGLPPEHPRASTTDDVEGFIATLHHMIGRVFDHKTFLQNYAKITLEFTKRVDPHLPFHYWTGANKRFTQGRLKSFNAPSESGEERLDKIKISRRSDPGVFVCGRASLPQKGKLTVRAEFHSAAERLPPPPLHRG